MSQTFDPVSSPDAYRRSLLAALGDDDPAIAQAETAAAIRVLIAEAGDRLRVRPEPGEWSALECIGHIADSEVVVSARVRWILSEDEPDIVGYDQALWVAELMHNEDDPARLLATFEALRDANLDLWARRSAADAARASRANRRADVLSIANQCSSSSPGATASAGRRATT